MVLPSTTGQVRCRELAAALFFCALYEGEAKEQDGFFPEGWCGSASGRNGCLGGLTATQPPKQVANYRSVSVRLVLCELVQTFPGLPSCVQC